MSKGTFYMYLTSRIPNLLSVLHIICNWADLVVVSIFYPETINFTTHEIIANQISAHLKDLNAR